MRRELGVTAARAGSTARGPDPGGAPGEGAEGQGHRQDRHPASRFLGTGARPCPAPQSPFRAPHRLHCRRRPLAAFTLEARWGRGEAPPHVRYRDATSACVRTNASKGGSAERTFPARPGLESALPWVLSDLTDRADGEGDRTEPLVFKMFSFYLSFKNKLGRSKIQNLPFASCNINYVQFRMIADTKHAKDRGAGGGGRGHFKRESFHPLLRKTNLAVQDTHNTK